MKHWVVDFMIVFTILNRLTVYGQDVVILKDGTILQGTSNGISRSFKGIRYAEAPVGELRWKPPILYTNPNTDVVVDATKFGAHCLQDLWPNGSEDCLFLNIFAPVNTTEASSLPVVVFIHGGSYISGAAKFYTGENMVEYWEEGIVVVTLDYRLNVFGFLGSDELRRRDEENGSTGNYGLQDQRMGFEWVRQNIASFGGDASRVVIMGESAGGGSVSNHLSMKKSWEYYTAAIIESGSFSQWITQPFSRAQSVYEELLSATNCPDMECLVSLSTEEVYTAHISTSESEKYLSPFVPTVDGVELMTHPWLSLTTYDVNDVPVIMGTNSDEGILFTSLDQRRHVTEKELIEYWRNTMKFEEKDVKKLHKLYVTDQEGTYPATNHEGITSTEWWALQRSVGDYMFSCPAKYASQFLQADSPRRQSNLFMYHFEYASLISHYAVHGSELPYVFHWRLGQFSDIEVSDMLSSFWGNFVMSDVHDPNVNFVDSSTYTSSVATNTLPVWEPYNVQDDNVLALNVKNKTQLVTGLKEDECNFMIGYIDTQIRSDFA